METSFSDHIGTHSAHRNILDLNLVSKWFLVYSKS